MESLLSEAQLCAQRILHTLQQGTLIIITRVFFAWA